MNDTLELATYADPCHELRRELGLRRCPDVNFMRLWFAKTKGLKSLETEGLFPRYRSGIAWYLMTAMAMVRCLLETNTTRSKVRYLPYSGAEINKTYQYL